METVLLALWMTAATAGPALVGYALWRASRAPAPVSEAAGVRRLTAARRVVRNTFVMDRPDGAVKVSCETRGMTQTVVLTVPAPPEVWIEPVRPLRLATTDLGDPAFDLRFECGGETVMLTAEVRAALGDAARVLTLRLVGGTLEGRWSTTFDSRAGALELTIEPHADRLCAVRRAFPSSVGDAWLRTALHDPVASVRIRAIDHLVAIGDRRASLALKAAATALEPEVVLAAALHTTDLPALRHLACEERLDRDLRRIALEALFAHDDLPALAQLADAVARGPMVADLVSILDHRPSVPLVMVVAARARLSGLPLPSRPRHDVEQALAGILGRLPPSPAVEDELVHLLGSDDAEVVRVATRGLAAVGTGRSVPALHRINVRLGVMRAVREAIRAIQARVAGQEGGMALVAERPEVGALSPAILPGGELSDPATPG